MWGNIFCQDFKMVQTYNRLKRLVGQDTVGRFSFIGEEIEKLGLIPRIYELDSPRGKDRHLTVYFDYGAEREFWLTANYDTFEMLPSANNNGSGVVTLMGLVECLRNTSAPVNVRLVYFDAGLDTDLITRKKRNPTFVPGSEIFLQHMINEEIEFIDRYVGAVVIQAAGKGNLCVFEKTGKKTENADGLNKQLVTYGDSMGRSVDIRDRSPSADNLSFLKLGLEAIVLSRYHEGAWHRMQTKDDDLTNVNVVHVDETINFVYNFITSNTMGSAA